MSKLKSLLGNTKKGAGKSHPTAENEISDQVRRGLDNVSEEDESPAFLLEGEQDKILADLSEELENPGESETNQTVVENVDIEKELEKDEGSVNVGSSSNSNVVIISGRVLLGICDTVFPTLVLGGAKIAKIKHNKKREDLVLTEEEKEIAEPMADKIVEELFEKFTPMQQFLIVMGSFYGAKLK